MGKRYKYKIIAVSIILIIAISNLAFMAGDPPSSGLEYVDLNSWTASGDGIWTVEADGKTVTQSKNGQPTFYLNDTDMINKTVNGTIKVNTLNDNDMIGFVFGFKDRAANHYNFNIFDWKQGTQVYSDESKIPGTGTTPKSSYEGFTLAHMEGDFTDEFYVGGMSADAKYLWFHEEEVGIYDVLGTDYASGKGWVNFQQYQFEILYTETQIKVLIDNVVVFDVNGTFESGKLGFYNLSQEQVIYGNVQMADGSSTPTKPIATADAYDVKTNTALTIDRYSGILLNDYDPNLDNYTIVVDSTSANGTLNQNLNDGSFIYTPNPDFYGEDSFTYHLVEVADPSVVSDSVAVSLTVNSAPTDIIVSNDEFTYKLGTDDIVATLTAVDENTGETHTFSGIPYYFYLAGVNNEEVHIFDESRINPPTSYPFNVTVTDSNGGSYEEKILITCRNFRPTVEAISLEVDENTSKNGFLKGVDPELEPLTYKVVKLPTKGTVELLDASTGEFKYTPRLGESGADSFEYWATDDDDTNSSDRGTVSININNVNTKPVCDPITLIVEEDIIVGGALIGRDSDGDVLTYIRVVEPSNGTISDFDTSSGDFKYTPNPNYNGSDSFTYKVNDATVDSEIATVSITVNPVNDKPVSVDGSITVNADGEGHSTLEASDLEEPVLTYRIVTQGTKGTAVITDTATGAYTYTPNADVLGSDSFKFAAKDSGRSAEVTIKSGPVGLESEASTITVNIIPSGVADLTSITLGLEVLDPTFKINTTKYKVEVANNIENLQIKCGLLNAESTLKINGELVSVLTEGTYNRIVYLAYGVNTIAAEVTAQDGITKKTYEVEVTRKLLEDASLSDFSVEGVSLSPAFSTVNLVYSASVSNGTDTITLRPVIHDKNASYKVVGNSAVTIDAKVAVPATHVETLNVGSNEIKIVVTAQDGVTTSTYRLMITRANPVSSGSSSHSSDRDRKPKVEVIPEQPKAASSGDATVMVDDKNVSAGKIFTTVVDDKKQTTVIIDDIKLEEQLNEASRVGDELKELTQKKDIIVTVPINTEADVAIGELNGQTVKNMEDHQVILQVETEGSKYVLPAKQINIERVSEKIGKDIELKDIKVEVVISKPSADTQKLVEKLSKEHTFSVVAPAVEFNVTCSYKGKKVTVDNFEAYVSRSIRIPEGMDHKKISTAVVVNSDGSLRHVPTKIIEVDGVYYAEINSLSNSTYSVIWHPMAYGDLGEHWAEEDINNMASRMINIDNDQNTFRPELEITRAEFTSLIVKGLGLKANTSHDVFTDVKTSQVHYKEIEAAYEFGLVEGIGDGLFGYAQKITREEAMVVVTRAMKITKLSEKIEKTGSEEVLSKFIDSEQSSEWAKESIITCIEAKIVMGKGNGILAPKDNITRAEVMTMISRLLQNSELI